MNVSAVVDLVIGPATAQTLPDQDLVEEEEEEEEEGPLQEGGGLDLLKAVSDLTAGICFFWLMTLPVGVQYKKIPFRVHEQHLEPLFKVRAE